jgi:glycosyltransferase involved in cell wall biosynthesis
MSDVAIYLNPEAFDTKGRALMGRQSAGESFLRGYLRHSRASQWSFWNVAARKPEALHEALSELGDLNRPITWVPRADRSGLARAGNVHLPQPNVARESWRRNMAGLRRGYGISGITHTTASMDIMDSIADLMSAPVDPWDTLICTSSAVRASVEIELEAVRTDLEERLGATRVSTPNLVTIPLAINTEDFSTTAEQRKAWRDRLDIPEDAVVVLYMGRFNPAVKMNPLPMAMALEKAAKRTTKQVFWVQAGWGTSVDAEKTYHDECRALCPSVGYRHVDGREAGTRFSIWSVADLFISLSDNIQETFGLTPLEAMAAGLPGVVSDWDGYRDTLRHGIDGFRAATYAPPAGAGRDLAYRHANEWISYDLYVGGASQVIAVSVDEAAQGLLDLIENEDLRRRMGQAAQGRARSLFDWSAVIPQYEALWTEMARRRKAAAPLPAMPRNLAPNPRRLDPFHLFGGYATEWSSPSTLLMLTPGRTAADVEALMAMNLTTLGGFTGPSKDEALKVVAALSDGSQKSIRDLIADAEPGRRPFLERGLLWMVKYDVLTLLPRGSHIA